MPALQNLAKVAKFCQIWSNYAPARPADLAEYVLPWSLSSKTPSSSNQRHFIYLRFIRLIKFIISLLSACHNSVVVTFEWKKSAWPKRQNAKTHWIPNCNFLLSIDYLNCFQVFNKKLHYCRKNTMEIFLLLNKGYTFCVLQVQSNH